VRLGGRGAEKSVDCLLEDREGHSWAGTSQGLFQLRPRLLRVYSTKDGLPHRRCWSLAEASDGAVWVDTEGGVARIQGEQVQTFADEPARNRTPGILVDREGQVWLGYKHKGVCAWRPGGTTHSFWHNSSLGPTNAANVGALYLDRTGRVWVGTSRGVAWFEEGRPAVSFGDDGLPTNSIRSIYQTRDRALWFGTWQAGARRWTSAGDGRTPGSSLAPSSLCLTTAEGLADNRVFVFTRTRTAPSGSGRTTA